MIKKGSLILQDFKKLKFFMISENLEKFSSLINQISILSFEYYEVWNETIKPMLDSEFCNLVNDYYLQFRNLK